MPGNWEIYTVTYRPKNPFVEDGWLEPSHMIISTQGGKKDAEAACKQYHRGCKIECVQTRLEVAAGVAVPKQEVVKKKKGN